MEDQIKNLQTQMAEQLSRTQKLEGQCSQMLMMMQNFQELLKKSCNLPHNSALNSNSENPQEDDYGGTNPSSENHPPKSFGNTEEMLFNDLDEYDNYLFEVMRCDDKKRFLPLLAVMHDSLELESILRQCAEYHAKKCLLAIIEGEVGPTALQTYYKLVPNHNLKPFTPLACVVSYFPEADDIVELLLNQAVDHAKIKCYFGYDVPEVYIAYPLDHALVRLTYKPHLFSWSSGASLIKLMILLCQWESKPILNCARLLAPHTDGINEIAWSYLIQGKLVPLAGLLLVAQEEVLLPLGSGLTIRQHAVELLHKLSSDGEGDLDYEDAIYQSMLIEACKLFDIFETAGAALSLYSSSMHEYVPPHKVLIDVATLLKKAGYALEPIDYDLRDSYRNNPELRKATMYKLSDPGISNNNDGLPSSHTRPQGFSTIVSTYPYAGQCQLFHKLKIGPVFNLKPSVSEPRLLTTAAGQTENGVSGITRKHLASIAFRLKRGVKF